MDVLSQIAFNAFVLLLAAIPVLFAIRFIAGVFSSTVREAMKRHKNLDMIWAVATILSILLMAFPGRGGGNIRAAQRVRTQNQLTQVSTAIASYKTEYGILPTASDSPALIMVLTGNNPRKIAFLTPKQTDFNAKKELIDTWGTPLQISNMEGKNPIIRSAGPDRKWGTADDLITDGHDAFGATTQ